MEARHTNKNQAVSMNNLDGDMFEEFPAIEGTNNDSDVYWMLTWGDEDSNDDFIDEIRKLNCKMSYRIERTSSIIDSNSIRDEWVYDIEGKDSWTDVYEAIMDLLRIKID